MELREKIDNYLNSDITLYSPKDWQVFQRQTKEEGYVLFSGACKAEKLNLVVRGKDLYDRDVEIKTEIKITPHGYFNEKIKVPSGGWYEASLTWGDCEKKISHIGVGEIIVGAGQSNATNSGDTRCEQKSGMVSSTDGINWAYGNDPMIGAHDMIKQGGEGGGSFYPALGDKLYEEFHVPVGIACAGYGATSVFQWQPGQLPIFYDPKVGIYFTEKGFGLYDYLMHRIAQLGVNGFRCLVWHQGESEWSSTEDFVYEGMANLILKSREDAGWYFPWFTAKASFCPDAPLHETTRRAHQKLWDKGISFEGPDTDRWIGEEYRDSTRIHFNPRGLKIHGEAWADFLIKFIHEEID